MTRFDWNIFPIHSLGRKFGSAITSKVRKYQAIASVGGVYNLIRKIGAIRLNFAIFLYNEKKLIIRLKNVLTAPETQIASLYPAHLHIPTFTTCSLILMSSTD